MKYSYAKLIFIKKWQNCDQFYPTEKKLPIQSYDITLDAERGTMLDKQGAE